MGEFLNDLRHGARLLVKQPSFTAVVGLTLALAIGANTLIFSVVSFIALRPLPFADRDTLAAIYAIDPQRSNDRAQVSFPEFLDFRERARSFSSLSAMTTGRPAFSSE